MTSPENAELGVETKNGTPHVRDAMDGARTRDGVAGGEVIGAVENHVRTLQQSDGVCLIHTVTHPGDRHGAVARVQLLHGRVHFRLAHGLLGVYHLAMQVG